MTRVATRTTHTMTVEKMFPFGSAGFGLIRNFFGGPSSSFAVVALSLVPAALLAGRTRTVALWAAWRSASRSVRRRRSSGSTSPSPR